MAASRNFLRGLSERVRRSLALTGVVSADLPIPMPLSGVVITDDATRPGTSGGPGNRRIFHIGRQAGAAQQPSIAYLNDSELPLVIENLYAAWAATAGGTNNMSFVLFPPDDPITYTSGTQIPWTDRPLSINDLSPYWRLQTNNLADPGTGVTIAVAAFPDGGAGQWRTDIVIDPGWILAMFSGAAATGTISFGIQGKAF